MERRFVLTDLPSEEGFRVTGRVRRCVGCAGCISDGMGRCSIDDDLTPLIGGILMCDTLEIHTGVTDSQFSMPMRKAVERISNVLQSFTDAGHNTPLDKESVDLRAVRISVHDGIVDEGFRRYAEDLLLKGHVETVILD